jgi:hypothetical protein
LTEAVRRETERERERERERENQMDFDSRSTAMAWGRWIDTHVGSTVAVHDSALRLGLKVFVVYLSIQLLAVVVACWALETETTQEAKKIWETVCKQNGVPFQHRLVDCEGIYTRAFDGQHLAWAASRLLPVLRQNVVNCLVDVVTSPIGTGLSLLVFYCACFTGAVVYAKLADYSQAVGDVVGWFSRAWEQFRSLLYVPDVFGQRQSSRDSLYLKMEDIWRSGPPTERTELKRKLI